MTYVLVAGNATGINYESFATTEEIASFLAPVITEYAIGEDAGENPDIIDVLFVKDGKATRVGGVTNEFKEIGSGFCAECGERFVVEETEVTHHLLVDSDDRDYDADADHVAYSEVEYGYVPTLTVEPHEGQNEARFFLFA